MRKTEWFIGLVLLCFLMAAVSWWLSENNTKVAQQSDFNTATDQAENQGADKPQNSIDHQQQKLPQTTKQHAVLLEINDRQFSQDSYTEVLSLKWLLNHCINNPGVDETASYYGMAYPTHEEMTQAVNMACERQLQNRPTLIKTFKQRQWATLFEPQSELGYLLKTLLDRNITSSDQHRLGRLALLAAIRAQNGIVLSHLHNVTSSSIKTQLFPIAELLQSHDHKYMHRVNQMAINLLSCQFNQGISCAAHAALMQLLCAKNPMACGQDFPTWYQNNTLPGMQRDVETLMAFYIERAAEGSQ